MPHSTSRARLVFVSCFVILATPLVVPTASDAADPEVVDQHSREFRVSVDGKPRGTQTITISRRADQSEVMRGEAEVVLNFVVYRYRYASVGSETWKNGKLVELKNEADFNGEKFVLQGSATEQAIHYKVNGESKKAPLDIWAASYYREPEPARLGRKVRVLDSDKGRQLVATLEKVGTETITAESAPIKATRYRMRGDVEVDVWYDRHGCIAKQDSVESGHKTQLELVKIQR